jgi:nicotinamide-nucleotide amidase
LDTELSLARELNKLLKAKGLTVAVTEGCTGGRIGERLVRYSGATEYFKGAIVTYDYPSRITLLGISAATLEAAGSVSEVTVRMMAMSVRERFGATIGLASSGVAGPHGRNVGQVWIAVATEGGCRTQQHHFEPASRLTMQRLFTQAALRMLRDAIEKGG